MRTSSVNQQSMISNEKPKASTQRMLFSRSVIRFMNLTLFMAPRLSRKVAFPILDTRSINH